MTTPDPLNARAMVPSRVDSVPAARVFLTTLLQGWSVDESVVDDAALLTTELMANALEHGEGLLSMAVTLEDGVLHVGVQDRTDDEQPHVLALDEDSAGGRGMWIVNIMARDWGTDAAGESGGKTVWFELSTPSDAPSPVDEVSDLPPTAERPDLQSANLGFIADVAGSYSTYRGAPLVVYQDKVSALVGDFARTLLTDFPIQGILDRLVERIVDALPVGAVGLTLTSAESGTHHVATSDALTLAFERLQPSLRLAPGRSAYETGEAVEIAELSRAPGYSEWAAEAALHGIAAASSIPLRHHGTVLGVLNLYRHSPGRLSFHDLTAAQTLADVTAAYVVNAQARAAAQAVPDVFQGDALRDPLTGLANRLLLHQRLGRASERAERTQGEVVVLFADLDRFKQVNDKYGHLVGDQLLVAVAVRLSGLVRPGDTLARVSGDEFVFVCEDTKGASDVEGLARRIDNAFRTPFVLADLELTVTASVGIAYSGPGAKVTHQLIVDADIAMYQAKRNGGAGHQIIDLREAGRSTDRSGLEQDLHAAFSRNELDLAFQPMVRSSDGVVIGAEALLRWTHPIRGPVSPLEIVDVAEENGLILSIGAWVLERACLQRGRWLDLGHPLDLAVNVSTRQLMAPGFCDGVAEVLEKTGMDPAALVLELTEAVFIRDGDRALKVLSDVKALGIRLALDDFGTGYSSLSYLRVFPVDILKIDRSFVPGIETDPSVAAIAEAITRLAHVLGLTVVVEGVETQAQHDQILTVGCDAAQGYFYARPMTALAFSGFLGGDNVDLHLPSLLLESGSPV